MSTSNSENYDAVVIGARCAGAATAMLLARAGLEVLLVDKSPPGTDTLSTHALMRGGVQQLTRWGLMKHLDDSDTPPISTTSFYYGTESVEVTIKPKHGVSALFAPRRRELDAWLVAAAEEAGATVEHQTSLVGLVFADDGRVTGARLRRSDGSSREVTSALVIGADGLGSKLARLVQAPYLRTAQHTGAIIYGYFSGLGISGYHWYFGERAAVSVIPTGGDASLVAIGVPPGEFYASVRQGVAQLFGRYVESVAPALWERVRTLPLIEPYRAFGGHGGFIRKSVGPGWALVGDASYFKDPGTAHGITDALRDAELLARAVTRGGTLDAYPEERDELSRELFELTDRIASFDWSYAELKDLHRALSAEMNRESDVIAAWDAPDAAELRALERASPRLGIAGGAAVR